MKRSASASGPSAPRKSARLAKQQSARPSLVEQNVSFTPEDVEFMYDCLPQCHKYNRALSFAKNKAHLDVSNDVFLRGGEVSRTIFEINDLAESLVRQLQEKANLLEQQSEAFFAATMRLTNAYEDGDLLPLPLSDLHRAVYDMEITDRHHFADYVQRILSESPTTLPQEDDTYDKSHFRDAGTFMEEALVLIQMLVDWDMLPQVLSALALLKTLYHDRNGRVALLSNDQFHHHFDVIMRSLVDGKIIPSCQRKGCKKKQHPKNHSKHDCLVHVSGLWWSSPAASVTLNLRYWNFASAARSLRSKCTVSTCRSHEQCIHNKSYSLLEWLQKQAWSELRGNVFRTIGTVFTAELTELIFQRALEAEGVPPDPIVGDTEIIDTPEAKAGKHSRMAWRVRPEYRCPFTYDRLPNCLRFTTRQPNNVLPEDEWGLTDSSAVQSDNEED